MFQLVDELLNILNPKNKFSTNPLFIQIYNFFLTYNRIEL
jgi:hypothetical protein